MAAAARAYELDDRSYLREKVITAYETVWRGDDIGARGWSELFLLKANAAWIQSHIATMPADKLRPVARRLFAECRARLNGQHDPSVQCHALETLSGLFLGLGCRSFRDFGPDVLNLLCSIEESEAVFGALTTDVKRLLEGDRNSKLAPALQRAALRLLLSLCCAAENLDQNILLEFVLLQDCASAVRALLVGAQPSVSGGALGVETAAAASEELPIEMREDAARLTVLLASYRRHSVRNNGFVALLGAVGADDGEAATTVLSAAVAHASRRVLTRAMYPEGEGGAAAYLGATLAHSLLRTVSWAAHALTIESYVPSALSRQLSGPHALAAHSSALGATMMLCWELIAPRGGAAFVSLCEAGAQGGGAAATGGGGGGSGSGRAGLLRQLLSCTSLLSCDVRDGANAALLRLAFLMAEGLAEGAATAPLLLQIDLGGGLPLWRMSLGRVEESALPSPQPLVAALLQILGDFLSGNLRKSGMQVACYADACLLLQRLLLLLHKSGQTLPLLRWPCVWEGVLNAANFISTDEMFTVGGVPELGLRLLQVLNQLVTLGDGLFPSAQVFESFAYEVVRNHRTFERLFKLGRRQAPQLVGALKLTRSLIVQALEKLPHEGEALAKISAAEAMAVVRRLQLDVPDVAKAEVSRPLPPRPPHERNVYRTQLLRQLLAQMRTDGSTAPLSFEELTKGALAAGGGSAGGGGGSA